MIVLYIAACADHTAPPKPEAPVVRVSTVAIRHGAVVDALTAFGTIVPAPGSEVTVSRPFETLVGHVRVTTGQRVAAGDPLLEFQPSADTRLRVDVARKSLAAAKQTLDNVKHRFDLGLATNADVLAAKQAVDQSSAETSSLGSRGATSGGTIDAPKAGIVATVHVQDGALVAAGQPLVELVGSNAVEAQFGVELRGAGRIHAGDAVTVTPVNRRESSAQGRIRSVAHTADPTTRLMPVMVTLTGTPLMLGEYVEGSFPSDQHQGLLVPRSAVLPESDLYILFTVVQGKARRHVVKVGIETTTDIEVIAPELADGDRAITVGNYGCADGAAVQEAGP